MLSEVSVNSHSIDSPIPSASLPSSVVVSSQSRILIALCVLSAQWFGGFASTSFGHGAYHDVIAELNAKLASNPDDADLRFRLATAHVEHGEWQTCLVEVARIKELAPGKFQTGYLTGKALAGEGKLDPALDDLNAFLAVEPGNQSALVERARVHLKLGQVAMGCEDYTAALAKPAGAELYVEAIEALRRNDRDADALALAEIGAKKTRRDPAVLLCTLECAVFLDAADRKEEARSAWRELHDHLLALPNLDRARPFLAEPLAASRRALGLATPATVVAPPAAP